ncbi:MAG TPA: galactose oxidase [Planctomycetota bacterium]|nr:galactose oxidase [Planctomycetota bacterium]
MRERALAFLAAVLLVPACGKSGGSAAGRVDLWTWLGGSDVVSQAGVYGTQGIPDPANSPGARADAASWTDATGVHWLFGGFGYSSGGLGMLNDFWKRDGTSWTWVSGSAGVGQAGTYGTRGVPDPANHPGARLRPHYGQGAAGPFWLFGGTGSGTLGDLWKFDGTNWTWVSGSNLTDQAGTYGVQGVADPANAPGSRANGMLTVDVLGSAWIFGGTGQDAAGTSGLLNDLWRFDGTDWTWISGSTTVDQAGVYGTLGVPGALNRPGGRSDFVCWRDAPGNLWVFGGRGYDSAGTFGDLNDLWKYDGTDWTWVSGSNGINQAGAYGTRGVAAATNAPGARDWVRGIPDGSGGVWMFGGAGFDGAGGSGRLNDLWRFDGSQWIWYSGGTLADASGVYGALGTGAPANVPGGRFTPVYWRGSGGDLLLFGGNGFDGAGTAQFLNDLWRYSP